jgi:RHS repeat-associated protein
MWSCEFDPWHATRAIRGAIEQPFRFRGHYFDSETGFHYVMARYFDPSLGRFLTPSLYDELHGLGAVVYCYGDPVNFVDPNGLAAEGGILWIQDQLKSAFTTAVEEGAEMGLSGSPLGKYVDGQMEKEIENINSDLQAMESRYRVMNQSERFGEFDSANPSDGWGKGPKPWKKGSQSKMADAIIVKMACNFTKKTPTYKDGQRGAVQKICRGYDWSVGQPENLAQDQAQYANMFTEGSTTRFQMWDANNPSIAPILRGAGVI